MTANERNYPVLPLPKGNLANFQTAVELVDRQ
jgi:hypothetical protein